jgi:hypothetical protein
MLSQIFDYVRSDERLMARFWQSDISQLREGTPKIAASTGSWDCASKLVIIPVKTSPLPAVAKAAFPVVFLYTFRH